MNFYTLMQKHFRIREHNWKTIGTTKKEVTEFFKWVHAKQGLSGTLDVSNVGLIYGTNGTESFAFGCTTDLRDKSRRCSNAANITCKLSFNTIDTDGNIVKGLSKSTAFAKMPTGRGWEWKFIPQRMYTPSGVLRQDKDSEFRDTIANTYQRAYKKYSKLFYNEIENQKEYFEKELIVAKIKNDSKRIAVCSHRQQYLTSFNVAKSIFGLIKRHDGSIGFMTPQIMNGMQPGVIGLMAMNRNLTLCKEKFILDYLSYSIKHLRKDGEYERRTL